MDREERSFNQTLREQQDEAYRESLRADQEKVFSLGLASISFQLRSDYWLLSAIMRDQQ